MKYLEKRQLSTFNTLKNSSQAEIESYKWSMTDVQEVISYLIIINDLRGKIDFYEKTYSKPYIKAVFGG